MGRSPALVGGICLAIGSVALFIRTGAAASLFKKFHRYQWECVLDDLQRQAAEANDDALKAFVQEWHAQMMQALDASDHIFSVLKFWDDFARALAIQIEKAERVNAEAQLEQLTKLWNCITQVSADVGGTDRDFTSLVDAHDAQLRDAITRKQLDAALYELHTFLDALSKHVSLLFSWSKPVALSKCIMAKDVCTVDVLKEIVSACWLWCMLCIALLRNSIPTNIVHQHVQWWS